MVRALPGVHLNTKRMDVIGGTDRCSSEPQKQTLNSVLKTWQFLLHFQSKTKAFRAVAQETRASLKFSNLHLKPLQKRLHELPDMVFPYSET